MYIGLDLWDKRGFEIGSNWRIVYKRISYVIHRAKQNRLIFCAPNFLAKSPTFFYIHAYAS